MELITVRKYYHGTYEDYLDKHEYTTDVLRFCPGNVCPICSERGIYLLNGDKKHPAFYCSMCEAQWHTTFTKGDYEM